ncbi:hypothetical protein ACHAWO_006947 [Cyclotella atomus]|uniref:Uncharacterized protein n=1 Tax=Cyclotella atomus TaxID=382360 RepID=A0ABD3Q5A5_9STRA
MSASKRPPVLKLHQLNLTTCLPLNDPQFSSPHPEEVPSLRQYCTHASNLGTTSKKHWACSILQTELPDKLLYRVQLWSKVVEVSSWVNKHPKNEHFKCLYSVIASTKSDDPNALKERDLDVATHFVLYKTESNDIKSWMQLSWVSLVQSKFNVQDTM